MPPKKPRLEDLLLENGLLKPDTLEYARTKAQDQNKTIEQVIRSEQLVYPEPLAQLKAESLSVPYIDLHSVQIDKTAMRDVPIKAASTYQFFAFGQTSKTLQVAMTSPDNKQALEAVRFIAKQRHLVPQIYCASPESIEQALHSDSKADLSKALQEFGQELRHTKDIPKNQAQLQKTLEGAPINKIFAVVMRHAIEGLASDAHIEPLANELRVRYRINGQLQTSLLLSLDVHSAIMSRIKILSNMQISASNLPQEGHFAFTSGRQTYSVRVAIMPTINGEKITLHLIDTSKAAPSFSELGLQNKQEDDLKQVLQESTGIVIVAGPDGSGKSTTVNTILSSINSSNVSIATVEETIEFKLPGTSQTLIRPAQGLTYKLVLRNLLHQDVDVILVEEIRDNSTAHLLTKGALAGRLMLSTINAHDALNSIPQLIDLGISPYVLSSSLRLLIAQRLVPRLCQACKQEQPISRTIKSDITEQLKAIPPAQLSQLKLPRKPTFYDSLGCPKCHERQTYGQVALFEVIPISKELAQAIAHNTDYDSLVAIARQKGCQSLRQDGLIKALQGIVRYEDVVRVTS